MLARFINRIGRTSRSTETFGAFVGATCIHPASPLTQSLAVSRVPPSAAPDSRLALTGKRADCGASSTACFAFYDLATSSWKTSQRCLDGELDGFLATWPESGLMLGGRCSVHARSVPHICDGDCSLWPTPTASMDGRGFGIPLHNLTGRYKQTPVRRVQDTA